jgi:UDP-N-acetyl-2-amino-2-deoxyglucuronate dehydrogenase
MKNFGLIGASGYIAPKHMRAIQETNNNLKCFLDPHDNVGYIDRFFPDAKYFRETERFERHLDRLKRKNEQIDYVSVCSPNYLHDSHIRLALRNGCDVICEKPLVINYDHLLSLQEIEIVTGKHNQSVHFFF